MKAETITPEEKLNALYQKPENALKNREKIAQNEVHESEELLIEGFPQMEYFCQEHPTAVCMFLDANLLGELGKYIPDNFQKIPDLSIG